jgi:hypothetical protein
MPLSISFRQFCQFYHQRIIINEDNDTPLFFTMTTILLPSVMSCHFALVHHPLNSPRRTPNDSAITLTFSLISSLNWTSGSPMDDSSAFCGQTIIMCIDRARVQTSYISAPASVSFPLPTITLVTNLLSVICKRIYARVRDRRIEGYRGINK